MAALTCCRLVCASQPYFQHPLLFYGDRLRVS